MVMSERTIEAIRRANEDRARQAARMLSAITGEILVVVEIAGMAGIFQVSTEKSLRARQDRGEMGTFQTTFTAYPRPYDQPTITDIEFRFNRKCWRFENGAIVYDDREHSGMFVVAEGVINYIPDDVQIKSGAGRVARVSTFAEAVRVVGVFATSDTVTYEQYRGLVISGILRVN